LSEAKKKKKQVLLFHFFAGHGVLKDGTQQIIINEYNAKEKNYEFYTAEAIIRVWARSFPNSY